MYFVTFGPVVCLNYNYINNVIHVLQEGKKKIGCLTITNFDLCMSFGESLYAWSIGSLQQTSDISRLMVLFMFMIDWL